MKGVKEKKDSPLELIEAGETTETESGVEDSLQ